LGDAVLRAAPIRRFCELCQTRPLPAALRPFRAPPCGPGLLVGWTHRNTALRPGYTVATITLWVTASVTGSETDPGPDSAGTRFLKSRLAAQLLCRITGTAATPSRGTGDICLGRLAPSRGGRHQLPLSFPRLPGIIPVALSAGFSGHRAATVLSRNKEKMRPFSRKVTG
jgi:hypothetical protein